MINFEIIFQLLFWILLALLFLDAIVITKNESGEVGHAWGVAILGAILLFIIKSMADWLLNSSAATFIIILIMYIPASSFFARKYAVVRGFYSMSALGEREELAEPLDFSEIFLSMLALLVLCFANSAREIGEGLGVFSIMSIGIFFGVYRFENKKHILWKENLRLVEIDKDETNQEAPQNQTKKYSFDLEDFFYYTLPVGLSYFGLPLLLSFSLYRFSPWIWGGFVLCLLGFILPHLFFLIKRRSLHQNIARDLKMLKHAENSGDLQFMLKSLENHHVREIAKSSLKRQFNSNPNIDLPFILDILDNQHIHKFAKDAIKKHFDSDTSLFNKLFQLLKDGRANWGAVDCLWDVTRSSDSFGRTTFKIDFAKQLIDLLLDKTKPIEVRTRILFQMVNWDFINTNLFHERKSEIWSDQELTERLSADYGIRWEWQDGQRKLIWRVN